MLSLGIICDFAHSEFKEWENPTNIDSTNLFWAIAINFSGHQIIPDSLWNIETRTLPQKWISVTSQSLTLWSNWLIFVFQQIDLNMFTIWTFKAKCYLPVSNTLLCYLKQLAGFVHLSYFAWFPWGLITM